MAERRFPRLISRVGALALGLAVTGGLAACQGTPKPEVTKIPMPSESATPQAPNIPDRVFAPTSFWYRELPANTPLDPNSAAIIQHIYTTGVNEYGDKANNVPSMALNTTEYTPPIWITNNQDPVAKFSWDNCQQKPYEETDFIKQITDLHLPDKAVPAEGTDKEMTIYNTDTKQYTDTWVTTKKDGQWTACWGGTMPDASTSDGVFTFPYGVTGAGLALEGGVIKAEELQKGEINHVIGIALPVDTVNGKISKPANRTDGNSIHPSAIAEGQLMRLPADLDIDAMYLHPVVKTIAKAAQKYGFIVWDRSGGITFRAQNPAGMQSDPYPAILQGREAWNVMWGDKTRGEQPFPFDKLQVLPMDY